MGPYRSPLALVAVAALAALLAAPVSAAALTSPSFRSRTDYAVGRRPINVALGDTNADRALDIVVPNAYSDSVSVLRGDGRGGFASPSTYAVRGRPVWVAVGDVTGDGHADIAVANETGGSVSVLRGDGTGGFVVLAPLPVAADPDFVGIAQLGPDAIPDLVTTHFTAGTYGAFTGTGGGSFSQVATAPALGNPHACLGDVDRDGRADLVVAGYYTNTVGIMRGDGAGKFSAATTVTVGKAPIAASLSDLDRDGRTDVLVCDYGASAVTILRGNAAGSFTRTDVRTGPYPTSASVSDLNGDGTEDLAVSNYSTVTASVLLGDGAGGFVRDADLAVGGKPWGVASGDLDGDGMADLVVSNTASESVSVLLNGGRPSARLTIDRGAAYATGTAVTLTLGGSGVPSEMMIANDASFAGASWRPYAEVSTWTLSPGEGPKTVHAKLRSARDGESSAATASILLDSLAPDTSVSPVPSDWVSASVGFSLSATDAGSGVARSFYSRTPPGVVTTYSAPVTISAQGTTTVGYRSVDRAGNAEATKTVTVRIDKSAPKTGANARAAYTGLARIALYPSDTLSGVAVTYYRLDDGPLRLGTAIRTEVPGAHTLSYYSVDAVGNAEIPRIALFTVY